MIQDIKYRKKFKHRFSKNIYKRFGFKLDDLLTQTYFCTKCKHNHIKKWFDDYGKEFKINDIYLRHFRLADFSSIKQCEVKISGTSNSLKGYFDDYILYDSKEYPIGYTEIEKTFYISTTLDCLKYQCSNCHSFKYRINLFLRSILKKCEKYCSNIHDNCPIGLEIGKQCKEIDDILEKTKPNSEVDV